MILATDDFFLAFADQLKDNLLLLDISQPDISPEIVYANSAAMRTYGLSREEIRDKPLTTLLEIADATSFPDRLKNLVAGDSLVLEGSYRGLSGSTVPLEITSHVMLFREKRMAVVIGRDITRRKAIEEELRASETRFQLFMEHNPAVAFIKDRDGRFLYYNPTMAKMFGERTRDWMGKLDHEIWPLDVATTLRKIDAEIMESGQFRVLMESIPLPDGRHDFLAYKFPIFDKNGVPQFLGGVAFDVTDRIRAEKEAQRNLEQYRMLMEQAADAIVVLTNQGHVADVNQRACELSGYTREELIGVHVMSLIPPEEIQRVVSAIASPTTTAKPLDFWQAKRKDGKIIPIEAHGSRLSDGRLVGILRDVSHRIVEHEREQQRQTELAHAGRLSTLGEMIAGLAHEMNQPLYAITNYAEACLETLQSSRHSLPIQTSPLAEVLAWTQQVSFHAKRVAEVIRRLSSFAKKSPPKYDQISADQLIKESVNLVQAEMRRERVDVQVTSGENSYKLVADSILIEQVIVNLLRNACEAVHLLPSLRRIVSIGYSIRDKCVEIYVRDHGMGIPADVREKIFESFYTTKPKGLGMGLAISRSIVDSHGGKIWFDVNDGDGVTFRFTLPLAEKACG